MPNAIVATQDRVKIELFLNDGHSPNGERDRCMSRPDSIQSRRLVPVRIARHGYDYRKSLISSLPGKAQAGSKRYFKLFPDEVRPRTLDRLLSTRRALMTC